MVYTTLLCVVCWTIPDMCCALHRMQRAMTLSYNIFLKTNPGLWATHTVFPETFPWDSQSRQYEAQKATQLSKEVISEPLGAVTTNNDNCCRSLANYCVIDTELDPSLAHFFDVRNSPLKVDPKPRQGFFLFLFHPLLHLLICLCSYYHHHWDRVLDRVYIPQAPRNS